MKICHFTSAHASDDTRVFIKECSSLAKAGHEVFLVAKGASRDQNGVHVIGLGDAPASRRERMSHFAERVYETALSLDCDVYHFHDPELLPYGIRLKKKGKTVIYDSHEDVPAQIMDKKWIPAPFRRIVSKAFAAYETYAVKELDAVVAATPYIEQNFTGRAPRVVCVCNYPILENIKHPVDYDARPLEAGYSGIRVSEERGAVEMVKAAELADTRLDIFGKVQPDSLLDELKQIDEKGLVSFHGLVPFDELQENMANMKIGLVVNHPTENAVNALCTKMFEYMTHGIVIISSDIPLWRQIVEDADCGICVDPYDVEAIAKAIRDIKNDPVFWKEKGMNGYRAVIDRYSWSKEADKLLQLYATLS